MRLTLAFAAALAALTAGAMLVVVGSVGTGLLLVVAAAGWLVHLVRRL